MPVQIEGIYRDVLRGPAGEIIRDAGWKPNLIVLRCRELLTRFLGIPPNAKTQALYHSVRERAAYLLVGGSV